MEGALPRWRLNCPWIVEAGWSLAVLGAYSTVCVGMDELRSWGFGAAGVYGDTGAGSAKRWGKCPMLRRHYLSVGCGRDAPGDAWVVAL